MAFKNVVFPPPLGPQMQTNSPSSTDKSMSSRTTASAPLHGQVSRFDGGAQGALVSAEDVARSRAPATWSIKAS